MAKRSKWHGGQTKPPRNYSSRDGGGGESTGITKPPTQRPTENPKE
jgi:hypothetical protein